MDTIAGQSRMTPCPGGWSAPASLKKVQAVVALPVVVGV
jgi:hypothetical protein